MLFAISITGVLYLIPAIQDWVVRGMHFDLKVIWSALLWLAFFYWGPMLALLFVKVRVSTFYAHNTLRDCGLYFGLMFVGISLVSTGLAHMFEGYQISWFDRLFSVLLWGGFFYCLYRFGLVFKSYQAEKLLRKQAQLDVIKGKLNPHFLFNSLNTISSLIYSKPDEADDTLQHLADVLRYSLDTYKHEWVPLEKELLALNNYLAIEQVRFCENLILEIDIAAECLNELVPPMLLQPVIENSFKHAKSRPLRLNIKINKETTQKLIITIADNGYGYPKDVLTQQSGKGHGLSITSQRIALLPEGKVTFYNDLGDQNGAVCQMSFKSMEGDEHD